jgi:hypothetical protein
MNEPNFKNLEYLLNQFVFVSMDCFENSYFSNRKIEIMKEVKYQVSMLVDEYNSLNENDKEMVLGLTEIIEQKNKDDIILYIESLRALYPELSEKHINIVKDEIKNLKQSIKNIEELSAANSHFDSLGKIHDYLFRRFINDRSKLDDELRMFLTDYERVDDSMVQFQLFESLRN